MLNILTQTHTSSVRTNRHTKLPGHQQHREHFIHSAQTTTVDLTKTDRTGLHELLEHHTILTVFTCGHSDWFDCASNARMSQHIVRRCRFFNPVWTKLRELFHVTNGFTNLPNLIGIHHQFAVPPNLISNQPGSSKIIV